MKLINDHICLSPTDLSQHLACRHLTTLNRLCAQDEINRPQLDDPGLEVLREKGLSHESAYLDHLRLDGLMVVLMDESQLDMKATLEAMKGGADAISQAWLEYGSWRGRADVLLRVPGKSRLGDYHYIVVDTKLSTNTKAGTILQLCVYTDLISNFQGRRPDTMRVVTPGTHFLPEIYRVDHFEAYYLEVKTNLEKAIEEGNITYPEPCDYCHICDWWQHCDKRLHTDDHISLVANITRGQRSELQRMFGIETLTELGREFLPPGKPVRGSRDGLEKVQHQAQVQLKDRESEMPYFEMLNPLEGKGLYQLPEPDVGDVFFDLEGDPFSGDSPVGSATSLEYLWGWVTLDDRGNPQYHHTWANNAAEERRSFEAFLDEMISIRIQHPHMHIYHYAPYEPGAIKRLMGRCASREKEVDELLRAGVFVDLYLITRQAIRAGVESYSIKELERFFGYVRQVDLCQVGRPKRTLEALLQAGCGIEAPEEVREIVRVYNEDDCTSTWRLQNWLEELRNKAIAKGTKFLRPDLKKGEPGEDLRGWQQELSGLREHLTSGLPQCLEDRNKRQKALWILAYILDWHWREDKAVWWEYFRLRDLPEDNLYEEKAAIAGLVWMEQLPRVGHRERVSRHRYRYPNQIVEVRNGARLYDAEGKDLGSVVGIDSLACTLDIKHNLKQSESRPSCVFECTIISTQPLRESLVRLGTWVHKHGIDSGGNESLYRAGRDLLLRNPPRRFRGFDGPLRNDGELGIESARRLAVELDGGVLPVQGPPGSGKTYAGARMIVELVRQGKCVGVTAISHKVIENLLRDTVKAAAEEGIKLNCLHKVNEKSSTPINGIWETKDTKVPLKRLQAGEVNVVGGTAWLWSSEDYAQAVDVLFVDEAGQMSLANTLAVSQAGPNLVLLGDPQQLEQPQKGSHPEGTEVSTLQHVLGDERVMPEEIGLFLNETWRLHPKICSFTSRQFYDGELTSRKEMELQVLSGPTKFTGAGLWLVTVEHMGNQSTSHEEVEAVVAVMKELLQPGVMWTDNKGRMESLLAEDILVVAPYNAQVGDLQESLGPDVNVGTVDRFQGQQAPVVIYSMTSSSPEDAPRGMEFLYSLNRLNVATSRALCACIMVASPRLFEPDCRTVRHMQLGNGICSYMRQSRSNFW